MRYLFGCGADGVAPVGTARFAPCLFSAGVASAAVRRVVRRPLGVEVSLFRAVEVRRPFREEARWSLTAEEGSAPG
jgi:hypothetical protein